MTMGIVGRKSGMTRIFTEDGVSIPVTVIEAQPNRITQVKTVDVDGYQALQVTTGSRRASRVRKSAAGHFAAAKVEAGDIVTEFRLDGTEGEFELGGELKVEMFEATSLAPRSVRASPVPSSATTSICRTQPTVTRCRIVRRVPLVRTRRRVAYSKARKWPATWVTCAAPCRTLRLCVWMRNGTCC